MRFGGWTKQVRNNLLRIQPVVARVLLDALLERRGSTYAVPSEASPAVPGQVHEQRDRAEPPVLLLNVRHERRAIGQGPVRNINKFEDVRVAVGGELGVLRQRRRRVLPPSLLPRVDDGLAADHRRAGVDELADAAGGRAGAGLVICLEDVAFGAFNLNISALWCAWSADLRCSLHGPHQPAVLTSGCPKI